MKKPTNKLTVTSYGELVIFISNFIESLSENNNMNIKQKDREYHFKVINDVKNEFNNYIVLLQNKNYYNVTDNLSYIEESDFIENHETYEE